MPAAIAGACLGEQIGGVRHRSLPQPTAVRRSGKSEALVFDGYGTAAFALSHGSHVGIARSP